jgi:hypothetical protein
MRLNPERGDSMYVIQILHGIEHCETALVVTWRVLGKGKRGVALS